jgi:vancomycin resistance protein YoaR
MPRDEGRPFWRGLISALILLALVVAGVHLLYLGRALPAVSIGDLAVSGKSKGDIAEAVKEQANQIKSIEFRYRAETFSVPAEEVGLSVDPDATAVAALSAGRQGPTALIPSRLGLGQEDVRLHYRLNQDILREKLLKLAGNIGEPARDAQIKRTGNDFFIVREHSGESLDLDQAVRDARYAVEHFQHDVELRMVDDQPRIRARDLTPAKAYAGYIASQPLVVQAGDARFRVGPERIAGWITFVRQERPTDAGSLADGNLVKPFASALFVSSDELALPTAEPAALRADINREEVGKYVPEVADVVDRPPENARLGFENNQLTIAGAPKDGLVLDRAAAVGQIAEAAKSTERTVALPIVAKPADIRAETLGSMGITTRIGTATTKFGGSPANRIFNIGVGARRFDGELIKPGQEFSFNAILGEVGPETGYRPELVIKENKTTPEYGGGLCQVSTTTFRAALNAGLPITDRTNHSYAVHYYAPIGMDATIYPPDPDLKFRNNTPGYILIQTHQEGASLTYEFYGTADGRSSSSEILSINATEEGGGTASFRYVVAGGPEPIDRVFYSSYKPRKAFPVAGEKSLN